MPLQINGPLTAVKTFTDPTSISGLLLWLDAADTNTITKDGNNDVTQFNDKSGNGNHFVNGTYKPKSGTKSYNGLNLLDLQTTTSSSMISSNNITIDKSYSMFIVCYSSSIGTTSYLRPNTGNYWAISQSNSTNMYCLVGPGTAWNNNSPNNTAKFKDLNIISFITNSDGTLVNGYRIGITKQYVNGLINATQSTAQTNKNYNEPVTAQILLGTSGISEYIAGTVAEVLIYNSTAFNTLYRQKVEGYLAWKWGIQTYLPPNHTNFYFPAIQPISSFSPKMFSTLWLWLDAADRSTITATGNNVTRWNDKSGNGYNFTNINTNYITTNNWYSINNTLKSNGGSSGLRNTSITLPTNFTVFILAGPSGDTNYNYYFSTIGTGNNNYVNFGSFQTQFQDNLKYNNTFYGCYNNTGGNTLVPHINTISSPGSNGSTIKIYQTGKLIFSEKLTNTAVHSKTIYIGNIDGINFDYIGNIGEILVFNTTLTDANRQIIEGYLAHKWEINNYLPTDHPYYSYFPYTI